MIKFERVKHYETEKGVIRRITIRQVSPPVRVTLAVPINSQQEFDDNKESYVDAIVDHLVEGWELPSDFPPIVSIEVDILKL